MTAIQDLKVHAPLVIAEGAVLIFVCSIMVFLRFYARKISGSSLGLDDCTIALALVSLKSEYQSLLLLISSYCAIAFCRWNGNHSYRRFEFPPAHHGIRQTHCLKCCRNESERIWLPGFRGRRRARTSRCQRCEYHSSICSQHTDADSNRLDGPASSFKYLHWAVSN